MKEICERYMHDQFGDDEELLAEIYGEYKSSFGVKLAEARAAFASGNWNALDKIAHTIKGNALAVGDAEPAETAIALRKAATLADAEASKKLIADLEAFEKQI